MHLRELPKVDSSAAHCGMTNLGEIPKGSEAVRGEEDQSRGDRSGSILANEWELVGNADLFWIVLFASIVSLTSNFYEKYAEGRSKHRDRTADPIRFRFRMTLHTYVSESRREVPVLWELEIEG
jgi:hypothetical protein